VKLQIAHREVLSKEAKLDDLKRRTGDELLHLREENTGLRKELGSLVEKLHKAELAMEKAADCLHREVTALTRRLEQERAKRDVIEDHLGKALLDVGAQVEWLRGAYHQASALMPAIGLNPFDHHADFSEWCLSDLVSFFSFLAEDLGRLRSIMMKALNREGIRAAIAVASRILSNLHHRDPFLPTSAILDDLARVVQARELRAVSPMVAAVVRLEKKRDFGPT
jgi:hypothetical protein